MPVLVLRACFVNDIERSLGRAAEAAETSGFNHLANSLFASLSARAKSNLLRSRTRRAEQGRDRVVHSSDWTEIVGKLVICERFHNHPCPILGQHLFDM